ncbi:MAG: membrane protein [Chloroflexota bacterium]
MSLLTTLQRVTSTPRTRPSRRLLQLYFGLVLFGVSDGFLVLAGLGLDPWDVFHQGLARHSPLAIGTWAIVVGAVVLLLWIPLRQMPGLGTVSNVIVVGLAINLTVAIVPIPTPLLLRVITLLAGVFLNGVATGAYIGAGLGPGPRDGLMTGLARRGLSLRVVRTGIELTVLAAGFALGGTVGIGTVLYAVSIGPLAHLFIPMMTIQEADATTLVCNASVQPEGRSGESDVCGSVT